MKPAMIVLAAVLLQGAIAAPAAAGHWTTDEPPDVITVCNPRHHCWSQRGHRHRFDALFVPARVLAETGVLGVWQRVDVRRHHRGSRRHHRALRTRG